MLLGTVEMRSSRLFAVTMISGMESSCEDACCANAQGYGWKASAAVKARDETHVG